MSLVLVTLLSWDKKENILVSIGEPLGRQSENDISLIGKTLNHNIRTQLWQYTSQEVEPSSRCIFVFWLLEYRLFVRYLLTLIFLDKVYDIFLEESYNQQTNTKKIDHWDVENFIKRKTTGGSQIPESCISSSLFTTNRQFASLQSVFSSMFWNRDLAYAVEPLPPNHKDFCKDTYKAKVNISSLLRFWFSLSCYDPNIPGITVVFCWLSDFCISAMIGNEYEFSLHL